MQSDFVQKVNLNLRFNFSFAQIFEAVSYRLSPIAFAGGYSQVRKNLGCARPK